MVKGEISPSAANTDLDLLEDLFERNLPADTAATISGCELSAKLIFSITGEKFSEDNSPGSLVVRSR